jgi:hypothetical protein
MNADFPQLAQAFFVAEQKIDSAFKLQHSLLQLFSSSASQSYFSWLHDYNATV